MIKALPNVKNPFAEGEAVIDFAALESLMEFGLCETDKVFIGAVDLRTGNKAIMSGKEVLTAIMHQVIPPQPNTSVVFGLDFASEDLERLCAAVEVTRGCCEYE